eukprot:3721135-Alexandrium_andersonii.AAC.1
MPPPLAKAPPPHIFPGLGQLGAVHASGAGPGWRRCLSRGQPSLSANVWQHGLIQRAARWGPGGAGSSRASPRGRGGRRARGD